MYKLYLIHIYNCYKFFTTLTIIQSVLTSIKTPNCYKTNLYLFLSLNNRVTTKVKPSKATSETVR